MPEYSKHQRNIIKNYYEHFDTIQLQKLQEQLTELYLAEGKAREKRWKQIIKSLENLKVPALAHRSHSQGRQSPVARQANRRTPGQAEVNAHHLDLRLRRAVDFWNGRRPATRRTGNTSRLPSRADRHRPAFGSRRCSRSSPLAVDRIGYQRRNVRRRRARAVVQRRRRRNGIGAAVQTRCRSRSRRRQQHGPGEDGLRVAGSRRRAAIVRRRQQGPGPGHAGDLRSHDRRHRQRNQRLVRAHRRP